MNMKMFILVETFEPRASQTHPGDVLDPDDTCS